jgi:hypothetical protein
VRGITRDTVSELADRKAILIAAIAASAGLLGVLTNDLSTIHIDFGGTLPGVPAATPDVSRIGLHFLATYLDVLLTLTVLLVAGVFPNFLEPRTNWFYFARPMDRQKVVLEKMIAVTATYTFLMLSAALPATLAGMIRHGVFDARIGEIILVQMCAAVVWIAIAASLGVLLRSALKVIPICLGLVAIQVVVAGRHTLARALDSSALEWLLNVIGLVIPRTNDLSEAAHRLAEGQPPALWWPIGSSLLFALVLIYSALRAVKRRDL